MRRSSSYIIVVLFCLSPFWLPAQRPNGSSSHAAAVQPLSLKVSVDKQKIFIGQPIQLMLEATALNNAPLTWPNLDTLPHFDWLQKGSVDSTIQSGGRYYRQYLTLTSWDSGFVSIPRLTFTLGKQKFLTDSIRIEVAYTKIDPNKDYHDIKDIVEVPNPFARWFGWIVAAVALVSLGLAIWLVRKKKIWKTIAGAVIPPKLSPYEEALKQLDQLEKQQLPQNGAAKEYYTRLGEIFRSFLWRRLKIASEAETSEELINELRKLGLPGEEFSSIAETLRMSDFVKFARYQPSVEESARHGQAIRSALGTLNKIGEDREAAEKARLAAAADRAKAGSTATPAGSAAAPHGSATTAGSATANSPADSESARSATPANTGSSRFDLGAGGPTNPGQNPGDAENPNPSNKTQQ